MKAILYLGMLAFLSSCDGSKEQLVGTQATLTNVVKERDDLKTKVASLQQELDTAKADLAKSKAEKGSDSAMASKTNDTKGMPSGTNARSTAKAKPGHKS